MSDLLEVDSIRKEFGTKQILTDIAFKCQTGDIIGMLGRNGSGKSTLLKIVFGTINTDYKFIRINGSIFQHPYKTKNIISYLNQDNFLPGNINVRKIVELVCDQHDVNAFLEDDVLSKVKETKIRDLSGGESRYLEVKLLLTLDAPFALLDEPFNGISPLHVELIKNLIREKSPKKGIILTDHDYRNVLDVANKYFLLYDGGLKPIKSKQDLIYWGYVRDGK